MGRNRILFKISFIGCKTDKDPSDWLIDGQKTKTMKKKITWTHNHHKGDNHTGIFSIIFCSPKKKKYIFFVFTGVTVIRKS